MKNKKVIKLNDNEELVVIGKNDSKILVVNKDNILVTDFDDDTTDFENIFINTLSIDEITNFILVMLLMNNNVFMKDDISCSLFNKLMDRQFELLEGDMNIKADDVQTVFQTITYF